MCPLLSSKEIKFFIVHLLNTQIFKFDYTSIEFHLDFKLGSKML